VKGLEEFPEEDWPAVNGVFQSYHMMVALGMLFIGVTLLSLFLLWRKQLFTPKWSWLMKLYIPAVALPVLANQLGWVSAERGRQPWIVQGLLRTSEGVSKSISAPEVMISLGLFVLVYILLFFVWLYVLDREIKHGPEHLSTVVEAGFHKKSERMDVIKPH
jgi:cytochrome d ubiquinol oxidase subunit I